MIRLRSKIHRLFSFFYHLFILFNTKYLPMTRCWHMYIRGMIRSNQYIFASYEVSIIRSRILEWRWTDSSGVPGRLIIKETGRSYRVQNPVNKTLLSLVYPFLIYSNESVPKYNIKTKGLHDIFL